MDYPKNTPGVGLVNGRFVDENPVAGTPGSLIPASWGNSVTQEILSVVQAAGLTPDEAANNQLLGALRGSNLFVTPPQFDTGKSVATSAFVQRALGNYSGVRGIAASEQLTVADVGRSIGLSGTTSYTVTLPDVNAVPAGAAISLHCRASSVVTVASNSGAQISPQGAMLNSITMTSGENATFVKESGVWTVYGTASLKYATLFAGVTGASGYQKYPSGNMDQWGYGVTDANGEMYVTFPVSFPNACVSVVANHVGGDIAMVILIGGTNTKQGCRLRVRSYTGQMAAGWAVNYIAKGY